MSVTIIDAACRPGGSAPEMRAHPASVAEPRPGDAVNPAGVRQYEVEAVNRGRKPKLFKGREPIYPWEAKVYALV